MKTPEWLSPGLYGAGIGAIALAIVGFSWGGWLTASSAEKLASDRARVEVIAALVPICVEQSKRDPQSGQMLSAFKDVTGYQRRDMLMEAGWATMPGASNADRDVASACADNLAAQL